MQIPPLHHDPHSSHTETRHTSYIKVSSPKLNHLQIHKQNLRMDAEELQKYSTPQSSLNFLSTQIQSRYEDREHTDTKLDQIRRFKHPRSPDDTVIKRGTIGPIEPSENSQLTNLKNSKNSKNSQLKNPQTKNPLKRKATTRRKKKPATKKITSLSAFVKETLGSKKSASAQGLLDYFGGNQLKVDDFISQMASATAKPFVCSDSESQLVGGEEWRLFLESVKLKFPNLSGPKRKSLVRISRRLDELKSLESNGNDVWSQASTQPKDDLTKEEMKWLYDIDDDQIQNDKSFEGEDSSIGLFFCTLSQALDPLDHVNLDMESEGVEGSYLENQEMDLGSLVLNPQKLKSGSSQSVSPDSPDASRSVEAQVAGPKPIASTTPPTFDLIHEVLENLSIIVADSEPELDSYTEKELLELLSHSTVPSTECSRPTTSTKNRKAITSRQFINVPESADIQSSITFLPLRKLNSKCVIGSLDNISDSLDVAVNVESSPIKGESQVIQPAQRAQKIPSLWSPVKIGTLNKPLQHSPAIDSSPIEKQNPEFEDSGPWIHSSIEIRSDTQLLLRSGDREYQNVELPQHTELISQDVEVHGRIELETSLSSQVKLSKIKRSHDLDSIPDSEDEENEVSVVHISRLISREIGPSEITPKKVSVALGPLFLQVPSSPGMEGFIPFDGQNE